jgi:4-aminobutyrate aminotransferase / (S)-3-amino-2-methylpropionate transaminase / 5-aminovalerate transaminase
VSTSNKQLAGRLRQVESRNVTFVSWESAEGSEVRDVEGRRYIDLTSAFAVSSLGHRTPAVQKAIFHQSKKLWHGMGDLHPSAIKVELLERLAHLAPGKLSVSILSCSGADAVESALKTARLFTGKPGVIAFQGAYHGLSYGTMALTDRREFSAPFRDQLASTVVHLPFPDSLRGPGGEDSLRALEHFLRSGGKPHAGPIGAILFEPVQGRGGIRIASVMFMKGLREISRRHRVLLIADEIMTGLGRTGRTFAVDHAGVVPDLLCLGKALANGFPLSVCIGRPDVMAAWPPSDGEAIHTSTFLGNPLGCAMALASLKELTSKNLAARAGALGRWWKDLLVRELGAHPRIGEIRGIGLMIGIEFVKDKKYLAPDPAWTSQIVKVSLKRGLIVLSGGAGRNVLTMTPPLTISKAELQKATQILKGVLYGSLTA